MKKALSKLNRITVVSLITAVVSVCGVILYRFFYIKGTGLHCVIYELTGLYCPGCGMGRASLALLHGDFLGAVKNNPFIFLVVLIGVYFIAKMIDWAVSGKNHIDKYIPPKVLIGIFIVLMIYGVLRNLPFAPFAVLRPQ